MNICDMVENLSHKHKLKYSLTYDLVNDIIFSKAMKSKQPFKYYFSLRSREQEINSLVDRYIRLNKYKVR